MNWRRTITLKLTATEAAQAYETLSSLDNENNEAAQELLDAVTQKLRKAIYDTPAKRTK